VYVFDYDSILKLFPRLCRFQSLCLTICRDLPPYPHTGRISKKAKRALSSQNMPTSSTDTLSRCSATPTSGFGENRPFLQAAAAKIGIKIDYSSKAPWISLVDMVSNVETTPKWDHHFCIPALQRSRLHHRIPLSFKSTGTWEQAEWLQDKSIDAAIDDALAAMDRTARFAKYKAISPNRQRYRPDDSGFSIRRNAERIRVTMCTGPVAELAKAGSGNTGDGVQFLFTISRFSPTERKNKG